MGSTSFEGYAGPERVEVRHGPALEAEARVTDQGDLGLLVGRPPDGEAETHDGVLLPLGPVALFSKEPVQLLVLDAGSLETHERDTRGP